MNRRRVLLPAAVLLAAVLVTGCVEQPFDESLLETTEAAPGVAAAPLNNKQARTAAQKARQAATSKRNRTQSPTSGGGGGVDDPDARGGSGTQGDSSGGDTTQGGGSSDDQTSTPRDDGDGGGGGKRPAEQQEARFRVIGNVADAQDDTTGQSPGYADVRQLLFESNGSDARITVALAARIPRVLEDGEVQGVGIDLYRSDDEESDYQIFVTGNSGGWEAFLHTPKGIVTYPGQFAIGGRVFVFELGWQALGGRKPADVSMFIDWSQERTILNAVGNDRAPNDGRITINPA